MLVERNVYPQWMADTVEQFPRDCESVVQALYDEMGLVFAYGEHVIDAVAASTRDAGLLGMRRGAPLLRIRRVTTTHAGRPIEWSDDRYRPGSVTFAVHNSIGSNPLSRRVAEEPNAPAAPWIPRPDGFPYADPSAGSVPDRGSR